jgi:heptosyltransferase-2
MAAAKAVVSNDSGLMHMAGFIGTPLVGLFGSTSPVWTRPLGRRSVIMQSGEPCAPCFARTCRYGHYRCQENIAPEAVAGAVEGIGEGGL